MEYEIGVISKMGYVDYFLIVWDFINYAKQSGHRRRARGAAPAQAPSSPTAWTSPASIRCSYSLLFERFLNPERVSMPDIDVDFCYERRQEVIDYVARTLRRGSRQPDHHLRHDERHARVVRDVGRVLGYPYAAGGRGRQVDPL